MASWLRCAVAFIRREAVLVVLLVALAVLEIVRPQPVSALVKLIDWPTLLTLAGLLVLTQVIETTGAMNWAAHRLLHRVRTERGLALALVSFAALLSTVLTNDVALFAVIPLAISLDKLVSIPLRRLVIVIAIAVNAGSVLTPLGNPQNLFLWGASGVSFGVFVATLAPLALVLMLGLAALTAAIFSGRQLALPDDAGADRLDGRTLAVASAAFVAFIALADAHHAGPACALVFAGFGIWRRRAVLQIDWLLLGVCADVHGPARRRILALAACCVERRRSREPAACFRGRGPDLAGHQQCADGDHARVIHAALAGPGLRCQRRRFRLLHRFARELDRDAARAGERPLLAFSSGVRAFFAFAMLAGALLVQMFGR